MGDILKARGSGKGGGAGVEKKVGEQGHAVLRGDLTAPSDSN